MYIRIQPKKKDEHHEEICGPNYFGLNNKNAKKNEP